MGRSVRTFGRQTLTFVTLTPDYTNLDRLGKPAQITTSVDVPGCRFRPLRSTEAINDTGDKVTNIWKATCPPVPAVLNATTTGQIIADGVTYQIDGDVDLTVDLAGRPFKATVMGKRITG